MHNLGSAALEHHGKASGGELGTVFVIKVNGSHGRKHIVHAGNFKVCLDSFPEDAGAKGNTLEEGYGVDQMLQHMAADDYIRVQFFQMVFRHEQLIAQFDTIWGLLCAMRVEPNQAGLGYDFR